MEIYKRTVGDLVILDLSGKMTFMEGSADQFEAEVKALAQNGKTNIILNMERVPYIDAAGLGALTRSFILAYRQGGQLKLLNLSQRVKDLLQITKMLTVYEVFEDEARAVASFSRQSTTAP
jgi:anti-sigma B factor antagonist